MGVEAKIFDPLTIKLGRNSGVILSDKDGSETVPLKPGLICGGNHYGFTLITEHNGNQKEVTYATQCRITAVGIEGNHLKIFEENKRLSWRFTRTGKLDHSNYDEFLDEAKGISLFILENSKIFEEPKLDNPLVIKVDKNPFKSKILGDKDNSDLSLCPGCFVGGEHYGFILIIDSANGQKEIVYPTAEIIEAIGTTDNPCSDFNVFEKGKYNPWRFNSAGKLVQQGAYNPYSKRDINYVRDKYDCELTGDEPVVSLSRKRKVASK